MRSKSDSSPTPSQGPFFYEWAFGALLAFLSLRALIRFGPLDPAAWVPFILLVVDGALIRWDRDPRSLWSGRIRLLFHPVAMGILYVRLGRDVPRLDPTRADAWLLAIDRWLLGETPAVILSSHLHPVATELLSLCYLLFYVALVAYHWIWLSHSLPMARKFCTGLYWIYAVGYVGYSLVPGVGPWVYLAAKLEPLTAGPLTWLTDQVVRAGCNGVDVLPSLHCAVALYFLGFDFMNGQRRRFLLTLAPGLGLCVATMYLRYHYAVDVLAGCLLAAVALVLVRLTQADSARVERTDELRMETRHGSNAR